MDSQRDIVAFSWVALAMAFLVISCSCGEKSKTPAEKGKSGPIEFSSPAFVNGASIPAKYTCDGENISPPLKWSNLPQGTQSLALICEDPDARGGTWVHWVLHSIPPSIMEFPEAVPSIGILPNGAKHGMNDFKNLGYGGPCPPPGSTHRYFFKLYALDNAPKLPPGISRNELIKIMEGHRLAEPQLMGLYQRK